MPKSSQTFYCKQFLQSYQSQVAHNILELDLHQEEVQHSLTLFTTLYNREINSSVVSHLQALQRRVSKIIAKHRYLEALSDTLESASRLLFPSSDNIPTPDINSVLQNLPGYIGRFRIE